MKPVILSFVLLLAVLLGFAWMNGKWGNSLVPKKTMGEKVLYFEPEIVLEVGKEGEINLMAKYDQAPVTGFFVKFSYDPTIVGVNGVEINKDIFNKLIENSVDDNFGSVTLSASSKFAAGTLNSGIQKLAIIKMTGLKKGGTVILSNRRPEVTISRDGKLIEGDFQMESFKVTVN